MPIQYYVKDNEVIEEKRIIPLAGKADVIVAGGGPAGIAASVTAARTGATVILIEDHEFLGGVATASMMTSLVCAEMAGGVSLELIRRMTAKGGAPEWDPESYERYALPFDKEVFKDAAMEMVMEAGVKLMLRTRICDPIMDNGKIVGVIIDNKSGMSAVLGKVVIDCSGDADLADRAGVPTVKGRESDHRMRPLTTLFRLGGLDIEQVIRYTIDHTDDVQAKYLSGIEHKVGDDTVLDRISGFFSLVKIAQDNRELYPECFYIRMEAIWKERGIALFNTSEVYNFDGSNAEELTKAIIEGRRQVAQLLSFVRKYMPGGERAYIIDVAPYIGVRETRRIIGEYNMTDDDVYADKRFEDSVMTVHGDFFKQDSLETLDFHHPVPPAERARQPEKIQREYHKYQIPYRTMLPVGVDNMLVAGRCIAISHGVDNFVRKILTCMQIGQVAGVAAAISAMEGITPKRIDFSKVKARLGKIPMDISIPLKNDII